MPRNKHVFLRLSFSQNVYFLDQQLDALLKRQMALTRSHHHKLIAGCIVKIAIFNQYFLLIYHLFNLRFITVLRSLIDGHGTMLDKPTFLKWIPQYIVDLINRHMVDIWLQIVKEKLLTCSTQRFVVMIWFFKFWKNRFLCTIKCFFPNFYLFL